MVTPLTPARLAELVALQAACKRPNVDTIPAQEAYHDRLGRFHRAIVRDAPALLAIAEAARELLAALPRCKCGHVATKPNWSGTRSCDEHAPASANDLMAAPAIRRLAALLGEPLANPEPPR